jgi:hypothetical protein
MDVLTRAELSEEEFYSAAALENLSFEFLKKKSNVLCRSKLKLHLIRKANHQRR